MASVMTALVRVKYRAFGLLRDPNAISKTFTVNTLSGENDIGTLDGIRFNHCKLSFEYIRDSNMLLPSLLVVVLCLLIFCV